MSEVPTTQAGPFAVRLEGELGGFEGKLSSREVEVGLWEVQMELCAGEAAKPPVCKLCWELASVDMQGTWTSEQMYERGICMPGWGPRVLSRATTNAPVLTIFSQHGRSRMTFACSDGMNPLRYPYCMSAVTRSGETNTGRVPPLCHPPLHSPARLIEPRARRHGPAPPRRPWEICRRHSKAG